MDAGVSINACGRSKDLKLYAQPSAQHDFVFVSRAIGQQAAMLGGYWVPWPKYVSQIKRRRSALLSVLGTASTQTELF
jgi:hypothetical protein